MRIFVWSDLVYLFSCRCRSCKSKWTVKFFNWILEAEICGKELREMYDHIALENTHRWFAEKIRQIYVIVTELARIITTTVVILLLVLATWIALPPRKPSWGILIARNNFTDHIKYCNMGCPRHLLPHPFPCLALDALTTVAVFQHC